MNRYHDASKNCLKICKRLLLIWKQRWRIASKYWRSEAMKQEIIEIDNRFGEEYQGKYVFKEITWAKRNRIIQKHTKYSRLSGDVESSDFIAIQAETIIASMHGQPDIQAHYA